ncbi:hypothetical protein [Mycolicibacterium holsaticum]|uniref:hypothetical protein n=1 Tax=Mycolicibacterium holsaticum TaxID=152142 RepID=UPI001C7D2EE3|nr:hypothetical protein [Mycolicibacterium holsaticum]MDA4107609.1 hypothetical protein [Mycolicibacterium holsaticum DSM 44478 = JCM 12374]QZA14929.1 hypothetical protein K3U96_13000 [Mycolicibacterium holsaticum DSM 44478 = JCM 12374]UNC07633.1 hypothetical protein H5U41_13830 [Mycolicibacterium holsaticum DSM 44478 = JCM 12374]
MTDLLAEFSDRAYRYLSGLQDRSVPPSAVLVSFGDDETTRRVIAAVQADGLATVLRTASGA